MSHQKDKIADVIGDYDAKMNALKKERDDTISAFMDFLKEKRLEELRKSVRSRI